MKVLFDQNVPRGLASALAGNQVVRAHQLGWGELRNGDLLRIAEENGFDVLITGDKNLAYQQNLKDRRIALIVLSTITWGEVRQDMKPVVHAVSAAGPGSYTFVQIGHAKAR